MVNGNWWNQLQFGFFKTPSGWCAAAWTSRGLSALTLPRGSRAEALRNLVEYLPPSPPDFWEKTPSKVPAKIQMEMKRGLAGKRYQFSAFDLSFLTPFQQKVLTATSRIPWGQTRTYGWVAAQAGSPKGFRAAGQALNRNSVLLLIPCHRVIAGGSLLGGYGGGVEWKIKLLKNEGIGVNRLSEGSYRVVNL